MSENPSYAKGRHKNQHKSNSPFVRNNHNVSGNVDVTMAPECLMVKVSTHKKPFSKLGLHGGAEVLGAKSAKRRWSAGVNENPTISVFVFFGLIIFDPWSSK